MTWDEHFLRMAALVASRSKDPSTQVGAVIVDRFNRVVSQGYNGFARGIKDTPARLMDREMKLKMTIHAELNAIVFAHRELHGCTMYLHPFPACSVCAAVIIQVGILRVVAPADLPERWAADGLIARTMYAEAGVTLDIAGE